MFISSKPFPAKINYVDADKSSINLNNDVSADEFMIGILEFFIYKTKFKH